MEIKFLGYVSRGANYERTEPSDHVARFEIDGKIYEVRTPDGKEVIVTPRLDNKDAFDKIKQHLLVDWELRADILRQIAEGFAKMDITPREVNEFTSTVECNEYLCLARLENSKDDYKMTKIDLVKVISLADIMNGEFLIVSVAGVRYELQNETDLNTIRQLIHNRQKQN